MTARRVDDLRAAFVDLLELWPPPWVVEYPEVESIVNWLARTAIGNLDRLDSELPCGRPEYAASRDLVLACLRSRADMLNQVLNDGRLDETQWMQQMRRQHSFLVDSYAMLPTNPVAVQP